MGLLDLFKKGASTLWNAIAPRQPEAGGGPATNQTVGGPRPNTLGSGADPHGTGYTQRPNEAHSAANYQRLREDLAAQQQAARAQRQPGAPAPMPRARPPQGYIPMQDGPRGTRVPIPLPQQRVIDEDIPTPDPRAEGRPHTTLGGRIGTDDGVLYRQSATFTGSTAPYTANGLDVPQSRVDWHDHSRGDHPNPHQHPMRWENGRWVVGPQTRFGGS